MASPNVGWTEPLTVTRLRADPSGVMDESTTFQAQLFPGMSTQTQRVRYISLFAAARYHRIQAGKPSEKQLPLPEHLRRLEALIAVASIRHHLADQEFPTGIVGRGAGEAMSQQDMVRLHANLANPPYRIYAGTMANLRILDTSQSSDPLVESAQQLATAWDPSEAGELGRYIQQGVLPDVVPRRLVDAAAPAFCLCAVPAGSREQAAMIRYLLVLERGGSSGRLHAEESARAQSWRFALELVRQSAGTPLAVDRTMVRLLRPDLLALSLPAALHTCLYAWRWVAARTFFERGWTHLFATGFRAVAEAPGGLSRGDFRALMAYRYHHAHADEPLHALVSEAEAHCTDPAWLTLRYASMAPRDSLLNMCAGIIGARRDRDHLGREPLGRLWREGDIPFHVEWERLERALQAHATASMFWALVGEETLIQHRRIALRKMGAGNPDSLLVDYDRDQWMVRPKAQDVHPNLASAFSRLDIALAWAQQLGLVRSEGDSGSELTPLGLETCHRWDEEYA